MATATLTGVGSVVATIFSAKRSWRQPIETCAADEAACDTQERTQGYDLNQLPDSRRRFAVVTHAASTSIVTHINAGLFLPSLNGYATAEHIG